MRDHILISLPEYEQYLQIKKCHFRKSVFHFQNMRKWHFCKSHYLCSDSDRMTILIYNFKMSVECLENILSFLVIICLRKSDKRQLRNRTFKKPRFMRSWHGFEIQYVYFSYSQHRP